MDNRKSQIAKYNLSSRMKGILGIKVGMAIICFRVLGLITILGIALSH
jgi:hypothetical protein